MLKSSVNEHLIPPDSDTTIRMNCTDTERTNNYGIYLVGHAHGDWSFSVLENEVISWSISSTVSFSLSICRLSVDLATTDRMSRYLHMVITSILDALKVKTGQVLEKFWEINAGNQSSRSALLKCPRAKFASSNNLWNVKYTSYNVVFPCKIYTPTYKKTLITFTSTISLKI